MKTCVLYSNKHKKNAKKYFVIYIVAVSIDVKVPKSSKQLINHIGRPNYAKEFFSSINKIDFNI